MKISEESMSETSHGGGHTHVLGAIVANLFITVSKFIVAGFTGSSAMISEGIHSAADTGNQLLLLLGIRESKKPADELHPFGRGKELYFWSLIVALILFGLGGGMSIYEGITHIEHPSELSDPTWNYVVLAIALIAESISQAIVIREFLHQKREDESVWESILTSKDPTVFVVLFENAAALAGIIVAGVGIFLAHQFQNPVIDGVASIIIGVILAIVALFLARESRALLIGERADHEIVEAILKLVEEDEAVVAAGKPLTMHFGPDDILLNLSVQFNQQLTVQEMTQSIYRIENAIMKDYPIVKKIFLEAASLTSNAETA
jgi:cation diffusion facilitator family transporter